MKRLRLPAALLVAAAFIALLAAGGATAARLVTGAQIKNGTITGADVKNGSLTVSDLRRGTIPRSVKGSPGPAGATGPAGAQGAKGDPGSTGEQGPAGPFPDGPLPAGKTIRGAYSLAAEGPAADPGALAFTAVSFGYQLAAVPTWHFVGAGDPVPAGCTGTPVAPGASPGHLCMFEQSSSNHGAVTPFSVSRTGASFYFFAGAAASFAYSAGTWAATGS